MKAAIIGYYRGCHDFKVISKLLGIEELSIQKVVENYLSTGKHA